MIFYRDFKSPLGPMIGGASGNGLTFLEWHDRGGVEAILKRVTKRYRCEPTIGSNDHLDSLESELDRYFASDIKQFKTAIDVKGTAFQTVVWDELLAIEYGMTRSYGEMAAALDKPGAARAVGSANGSNYLSIVIPCHRVIEANGNMRGYGGRVWRKKYLLQLESGIKQPELPADQTILL